MVKKRRKIKKKRCRYIISGPSASGEGWFRKTVYSKKDVEFYKVRGYDVKKVCKPKKRR